MILNSLKVIHVAKFLSGLNSHFQTIQGQIVVGDSIPSLNNVYALVLQTAPTSSVSPSPHTSLLRSVFGPTVPTPCSYGTRLMTFFYLWLVEVEDFGGGRG